MVDAHGTLLAEGDKVTLIKDLKVKGSLKCSRSAQSRHQRLKEGKDHQLDCKVDGEGDMMVTVQFVKRPEAVVLSY